MKYYANNCFLPAFFLCVDSTLLLFSLTSFEALDRKISVILFTYCGNFYMAMRTSCLITLWNKSVLYLASPGWL